MGAYHIEAARLILDVLASFGIGIVVVLLLLLVCIIAVVVHFKFS
jgi:hypothetical protein